MTWFKAIATTLGLAFLFGLLGLLVQAALTRLEREDAGREE